MGSSPIVSTTLLLVEGLNVSEAPAGALGSCQLRATRPAKVWHVPTTRRRHFGSVRKLPSGRYQVRYWHAGTSRSAPQTFKTRTDALAWLSTVEADLLRGSWVDPDAGRISFEDYANAWLEHQQHLRPRTIELYRYLLDRHLLPAFGNYALVDIAPSEVAGWHRQLFAQLPGTAPKAYRFMAQLMGAAVKDERILRNPCSVKGASGEQRKEQAIPTVAEVEALAGAVPERYKVMVLLAAWCSLRYGELAALRRSRIDLMHAEIEVVETITELTAGDRFAGPPKTDAGRRTVTIPPHLIPLVESHLRFIEQSTDALVFPAPEGGYLQRHNFRHRVWVPALTATGLSYRFHDLRHSGLTWVAASGATVAELMHRGGHASPAAAMRYQHATKERDRALAQALSDLAKPAPIL